MPKDEETVCDPTNETINILSSFNNSGIWPVGMKFFIVITLQHIDAQISCLVLILHDTVVSFSLQAPCCPKPSGSKKR